MAERGDPWRPYICAAPFVPLYYRPHLFCVRALVPASPLCAAGHMRSSADRLYMSDSARYRLPSFGCFLSPIVDRP